MISRKFADRLQRFVHDLETPEELRKHLSFIDNIHTDYDDKFGDKFADKVGSSKKAFLLSCISDLRGNPQVLFEEVKRLELAISSFQHVLHVLPKADLSKLGESVDRFREAYNNFISVQEAGNVFFLLQAGQQLWKRIENIEEFSELVLENIRPEIVIPEGYQRLVLEFESDISYAAFSAKIEAILKIYSELCELLKVSEKEYPLRIIKIETGSSLLDVIGNAGVIALITTLLQGIAFLIYNRTRRGRTDQATKEIELHMAAAELEASLKEKGYKTEEMKEHIQKSALAVIRQLPHIFKDEASIRIDKQRFEYSDDLDQKMLKANEIKYLEAGSKEEEAEDED